jgi:hypothetical protein
LVREGGRIGGEDHTIEHAPGLEAIQEPAEAQEADGQAGTQIPRHREQPGEGTHEQARTRDDQRRTKRPQPTLARCRGQREQDAAKEHAELAARDQSPAQPERRFPSPLAPPCLGLRQHRACCIPWRCHDGPQEVAQVQGGCRSIVEIPQGRDDGGAARPQGGEAHQCEGRQHAQAAGRQPTLPGDRGVQGHAHELEQGRRSK